MTEPSGRNNGAKASDGAKPLIPPPPRMGEPSSGTPPAPTPRAPTKSKPTPPGQAREADAPAPEAVSETESTAPLKSAIAAQDGSIAASGNEPAPPSGQASELEDAAEELDAEPSTSEYKRPTALPRPKKLGASKAADFREQRRTGAETPGVGVSGSAIPRGIKPPGPQTVAPDEVSADDTDVLIASVADELTSIPPPDTEEPPEPSLEADDASSQSPVAVPRGGEGRADTASRRLSIRPSGAQRPPWLLPAAAAALVILVVAFIAWPSEESVEEVGEAVQGVAAERSPEPEPTPQAEPELEPAPQPDPQGPEGESAGEELGEPLEIAIGEATATDGAAEAADEATGGQAGDDATPAEAMAEPEPSAEPKGSGNDDEPKRKSSSRKRSKKRSSDPEPKPEPKPEPAPSAAAQEPTAPELLTQARTELRRGRASSAYSLASKSYRLKKTSGALVIMARAACRMKDAGKAKSAFHKLAIVDRTGIRSECRDHGVKLGI